MLSKNFGMICILCCCVTASVLVSPVYSGDITAPGNPIIGIPDNGNWPGTQSPSAVIDGNINTEYIHYDGDSVPSGFAVTPRASQSTVYAISFTTGGGASSCDPKKFSLYGSNDAVLAVSGSWTPIIENFSTYMSTTRHFTGNPINFINTVAYTHYKVMFPDIRNPASADSMQIAEVELIGDTVMSITDSQFGLFDRITEPELLSSGTLTMEKENWTPGTQWWQSSIWDETDAFNAQFDFDDDDPSGLDWRVKISKGGGLYSIDIPGLGEIMPPQRTDISPWNDDTCLATLISNHNSDPEMQGYGNGFIHQTGMYVKPHLDPLNNNAFFSPLLAEEFDAASGSYSVVNWGLAPSPSVNRADVLFYTKYRHLGAGVIEITFYFYNYGDLDHGNPAVPWTGVRESIYPEQIRGVAGGGFELLPYEYEDRRYDVRTSGGWIGHTADPNDNNSPAYSLVHGLDKHYGQPGYEGKWGNTTCFNLDATGGGRDFKVMAMDIRCDIKSGEGLFSRTYMVMGSLGDVVTTSEQLIDEVDCGWLEFNEMATDFLPLYEITLDGQTTLSAEKPDSNATPIAHSYANPVKNSVPLILMREIESGTYVLSTDPYAVCGKRTFDNLYDPNNAKYETYQNRVIYQPYDGRTEWIGLLGFVIPESKSTDPQEYQPLWEALGEDILFVPGEKFAADELLIWTGNQDVPSSNNPPVFGEDPIVRASVDDYQPYSDTIFASATDPDDDNLIYSKLIGPAWLNITDNGTLSGIPGLVDASLNTWSVQVSDGNGRTDIATLNITVTTEYADQHALVQWGQKNGQADILTERIDGDASSFNNVYNPALLASPSDANYYPAPASDNRTPRFYAAGQRNNWRMEITNQTGGDYIGAYHYIPPGTTHQAMVVWQSADFMPVDGPVAGFNAQLKNSKGGDRGDLYCSSRRVVHGISARWSASLTAIYFRQQFPLPMLQC